jgi:hypothetical protein
MAIIKGFVHRLLNSLSRHFSEAKTGPAMYPLELSIADYRGIRIIRRPGFRRAFPSDCGKPYGENLTLFRTSVLEEP